MRIVAKPCLNGLKGLCNDAFYIFTPLDTPLSSWKLGFSRCYSPSMYDCILKSDFYLWLKLKCFLYSASSHTSSSWDVSMSARVRPSPSPPLSFKINQSLPKKKILFGHRIKWQKRRPSTTYEGRHVTSTVLLCLGSGFCMLATTKCQYLPKAYRSKKFSYILLCSIVIFISLSFNWPVINIINVNFIARSKNGYQQLNKMCCLYLCEWELWRMLKLFCLRLAQLKLPRRAKLWGCQRFLRRQFYYIIIAYLYSNFERKMWLIILTAQLELTNPRRTRIS